MSNYYNDQWRLPNNENKDKQSNYSMDFDGSQYIDTNYYLPDGTKPKSISYWFKNTDPNGWSTTGYNYTIHGGALSTGAGFGMGALGSNFGSYLWFIGHSAGDYLIPASATGVMTTDVWYHIVVTYDNSRTNNLHFYLDGVKIDETNETLNTSTANSVKIGASATGGGNSGGRFMEITDVCIFNYALSDGGVSVGQTATGQIATLYGGGSAIGNPMSLSPAPVSYYPLGDQDAFNGAEYLVPNSSLKDYVFDFDGNDYIDAGTGLGDSLGGSYSGDLTVSMWLKFDSTSTQYGLFYIGDLAGGGGSFWINTSLSKIWLQANNGSAGYINCSISSLNTTDWYNLTFVYKGYDIANSKIYINNVSQTLTTSGDFNYTYDFTSKKTAIGDYYTTPPFRGFNGKMSNAQIFNTALPATGSNSIETLYNNGSPLTSMSGFTSLQGWWKLDASATYDGSNWTIEDSSSNSNDGTSSGMTQANLVQSDLSFKTSISPYALDFDGANDYIDCGTGLGNSLGNSYSGDLSISIWFKATSIGTAPGLFSINNGNGLFGPIQIYFYNNRLYFRVQPTQSGFNYISIPFTNTTSWHHLTVVYKSGSQSNSKMYLDGADTSTNSGGSFPTILDFDGIKTLIGYYYSDSYLFNGSISNVSIWNTALTQAQVTEIYAEGVPQNLNNHSAYSNLVSWWQLGSNSSFNTNWTVLDEVTASGNNGTSVNMIESDITDGVNSYANGLSSGMGGDEVIGDAPYSSSNSLSVNMDVEDRTTDTPS